MHSPGAELTKTHPDDTSTDTALSTASAQQTFLTHFCTALEFSEVSDTSHHMCIRCHWISGLCVFVACDAKLIDAPIQCVAHRQCCDR